MCRLSDGFIFLKKLLGMDRKNLTNIFFYINKKKNLESRKNKKANFKKNKFQKLMKNTRFTFYISGFFPKQFCKLKSKIH